MGSVASMTCEQTKGAKPFFNRSINFCRRIPSGCGARSYQVSLQRAQVGDPHQAYTVPAVSWGRVFIFGAFHVGAQRLNRFPIPQLAARRASNHEDQTCES